MNAKEIEEEEKALSELHTQLAAKFAEAKDDETPELKRNELIEWGKRTQKEFRERKLALKKRKKELSQLTPSDNGKYNLSSMPSSWDSILERTVSVECNSIIKEKPTDALISSHNSTRKFLSNIEKNVHECVNGPVSPVSTVNLPESRTDASNLAATGDATLTTSGAGGVCQNKVEVTNGKSFIHRLRIFFWLISH